MAQNPRLEARRLVQVGIRTLNAHQAEQARRFGIEVVGPDGFAPQRVPIPRGPLYVSIDLDALDPAFAPGVAHPEPGGLSARDVIQVLHRVRGPVVGADVVELLPAADQGHRTAVVAAKLVKELAGVMLRRQAARGPRGMTYNDYLQSTSLAQKKGLQPAPGPC